MRQPLSGGDLSLSLSSNALRLFCNYLINWHSFQIQADLSLLYKVQIKGVINLNIDQSSHIYLI